MAVNRTTDQQLEETYDRAFEASAKNPKTQPGDAHKAGLRAVHERGAVDASKRSAS